MRHRVLRVPVFMALVLMALAFVVLGIGCGKTGRDASESSGSSVSEGALDVTYYYLPG